MNDITRKLLKYPNVILVGRGKKLTGGVNTGRDCVVVGVIKKMPIETLNKKDIIPSKVYSMGYILGIEGMETDVVEVGVIRTLSDRTAKYRPAPGGVSIGHYLITAGTLGMVVKKGGVRFILSNNHVLANENKGAIGDAILQPGPYDGGTSADEIAKLSEFVHVWLIGEQPPSNCPVSRFVVWASNLVAKTLGRKTRFPKAIVPSKDVTNKVDCALARPDNDVDVLDSILEIGTPDGMIEGAVGMKIKKSGRTTGLNHDEIAAIDAVVQVQYSSGVAIFEDQLVTAGPMAQGGDSGSAVLTEDNQVVGLLFAGSDTIAILNKFSNVRSALLLG